MTEQTWNGRKPGGRFLGENEDNRCYTVGEYVGQTIVHMYKRM